MLKGQLIKELQQIRDSDPNWKINKKKEVDTIKTEFEQLDKIDRELCIERETNEIFIQIVNQLDVAIQKFIPSGGAIVRLSTLSPKDAVLKEPRILNELKEEIPKLDKLYKERPEFTSEIIDVIAFIRCCVLAMKVKSGKEALELLVKREWRRTL